MRDCAAATHSNSRSASVGMPIYQSRQFIKARSISLGQMLVKRDDRWPTLSCVQMRVRALLCEQ